MKNKLRLFALIAVCLLLAIGLAGCGSGSGTDSEYKVAVSYPEGVTIEGANPATVKHGESVSFKVTIPDGYVFKSCDGAVYDQATGTLTVSNVTEKMYLEFLIEEYTYDRSETFTYVFRPASDSDTTDILPGTAIASGTRITVTAGDTEGRAFVGWTIGAPYADGGRLVSTSIRYSFLITPENVTDGVLILYSNYVDADTLTYDANGGVIDTSSKNITSTAYYTAVTDTETSAVSVTYGTRYLSYMECACSFYDDGTFTREGYVLKEYNTSRDGTGTAYSLGSKVPMVTGGEPTVLYCIWARVSDESDFLYEDVTVSYPMAKASTAPHWQEQGIRITAYLGDDAEVVIPEKIDGKYVTVIGEGAISGKSMHTLVLHRYLLRVEDGAVTDCPSLETVYFPDGLYEMGNDALDSASYTSLCHLYVNATIAPRYVSADTGALSVKLSRLLASENMDRIIIVGGSSSYQGIGTEYLERLLDGAYRVVNFGTTRTTHGLMYLEAMQELAHEGDVIIYTPENSSYMFGERELYWKTLRDLEGMNNIYRYIDISSYTNVFGAFTDFNQNHRYNDSSSEGTPHRYEDIIVHGSLLTGDTSYASPTTNKYGDYLYYKRSGVSVNYNDAYFITMDEHVKSKDEGAWNDTENQYANRDYTDDTNITWTHITDSSLREQMNRAITLARSSGAGVYFGFCPVDADALVDGASSAEHLSAYDALIGSLYCFDGTLGSCADYIFAHEYFYDCAFHLNDTGRSVRTYVMYLDLARLLGISDTHGYTDVGTDYEGCTFAPEYFG